MIAGIVAKSFILACALGLAASCAKPSAVREASQEPAAVPAAKSAPQKPDAAALAALPAASPAPQSENSTMTVDPKTAFPEKIVPVRKTDAEWRRALTPEQYRITREQGTERACSGGYWNKHDDGFYLCSNCGLALYDSRTKFESGTGWPSFFKPIKEGYVESRDDDSLGMRRTEILCARCGAHLGHVFEDGPPPTNLRFCVNSGALKFVERAKLQPPDAPKP